MATFKQFLSEESPNFITDVDKIKESLYRRRVIKFGITKEGIVNIYDDFELRGVADHLPYRFGIIHGSFSIENCGIYTLEGCPKEIGGAFFAGGNHLKTLEYGPREVGGKYSCRENKLETLKGCAKYVHNFDCSANEKLKSLEHGPREVQQDYTCHGSSVVNFVGLPKVIPGNLYFDSVSLKSFEGANTKIGHDCYITTRSDSIDFADAKIEIEGSLTITCSSIQSIEQIPSSITVGRSYILEYRNGYRMYNSDRKLQDEQAFG